jgi:hypothetical protein
MHDLAHIGQQHTCNSVRLGHCLGGPAVGQMAGELEVDVEHRQAMTDRIVQLLRDSYAFRHATAIGEHLLGRHQLARALLQLQARPTFARSQVADAKREDLPPRHVDQGYGKSHRLWCSGHFGDDDIGSRPRRTGDERSNDDELSAQPRQRRHRLKDQRDLCGNDEEVSRCGERRDDSLNNQQDKRAAAGPIAAIDAGREPQCDSEDDGRQRRYCRQ